MDRTLSTQAKFESSNLGLLLGTQFTPRGWIFLTIFFYHQKIHPRGVIWVPRIRPGFDDSNLASALRVRSI